MKKHETYKGNFLKAESLTLGNGKFKTMTVTITEITSHTFDDGKAQRVLTFRETEQQLGLNLTNWDSVAEITGKDDDDEWIGARVELWVDKNVMYGGKKMPAVRIRAVGGATAGDDAPPKPPAVVYGKPHAWAEFCSILGARGLKPDPEMWKASVVAVMNAEGKEQDSFTPADWRSVVAMIPADQNKDADIPF